MNPILAAILKHFESDPAGAISALGPALNLFGAALVPFLIQALPAGAFKTYAEGHPAEVLALLKDALAVATNHPEIVKAAAAQFA